MLEPHALNQSDRRKIKTNRAIVNHVFPVQREVYSEFLLLVIVLTRAAPALQYHFLFFFLSWACCLQLCSYDHLREKR